MGEQLSEIQYLAFCTLLVNINSAPIICFKHFPSASHPNICCTENTHSAPEGYEKSFWIPAAHCLSPQPHTWRTICHRQMHICVFSKSGSTKVAKILKLHQSPVCLEKHRTDMTREVQVNSDAYLQVHLLLEIVHRTTPPLGSLVSLHP